MNRIINIISLRIKRLYNKWMGNNVRGISLLRRFYSFEIVGVNNTIEIQNHVWLGYNVNINKGVIIEENSVVAGHSLVTANMVVVKRRVKIFFYNTAMRQEPRFWSIAFRTFMASGAVQTITVP
jgi:hypothetical protein